MADKGADRRRRWAMLGLAVSLVLAFGAVNTVVWVVSRYTSQIQSLEAVKRERITVPVTTRVVGAGAVLAPEDLVLVEMPPALVPLAVETQLDSLVGQTVVERLLPGEFVRPERLGRPGGGSGLSALIPSGMRAVSLNLQDGDRVSGFLQPGDGVDVLVTLQPAGTDAPAETSTLLQGVRVLAVDERISESVSGEKVPKAQVTVAIPPNDVEKVTHALAVGKARLTLRASVDMTQVETHGATVSEMLGTETSRLTVAQFKERVQPADLDRMVEMIHGREKKIERVEKIDQKYLRAFEP